MGRHLLLLRGINVGGKNKLPMKTLVGLCEQAGCSDVTTYIQSGNVLVDAPAGLARNLPGLLSASIEEQAGLQVPVVIRAASALQRIVESCPFEEADLAHTSVGFLARKPTAASVARLDPDRSPPDRFAVIGQEIYLLCPDGVARSKLTSAYFDRTLGTISTFRNWRTTLKLLEMAG